MQVLPALLAIGKLAGEHVIETLTVQDLLSPDFILILSSVHERQLQYAQNSNFHAGSDFFSSIKL